MDLADRGHAAMAVRYGLGAKLDGGDVVETPDGLMFAGRTDFPVLVNGAVPAVGGDPRALASAAREFFAARGRGFSLFTRSSAEDEAATQAGLHLLMERYPAMVLRSRVPEPDVESVLVSDAACARQFLHVVDSSFASIGLPPGVLGDMPPEAFFGRDDTAAFVAYLDGEPVAAASVVLARGIGGVQWVGVLEQARGRGLGAGVTALAANASFDMGADCAWLEASHMGEPVYARMGFEEVFSYRVYVAPPPE